MKNLASVITLLLVAALAALLNFGCASSGSGGGGLTLHQTHQQVEEAMLAFRNASVSGNITTAQREKVQTAYKNYQVAYEAAIAEAGSNEKAAAPDSVKAAAEAVVASVSAIP